MLDLIVDVMLGVIVDRMLGVMVDRHGRCYGWWDISGGCQ